MTIIKAQDYTPLFVDNSVLELMKNDSTDGDTLDFSDVNVMDRAINILAEILLEKELEIIGLDEESTELLETHIQKLSAPIFEDINEYKKMFEAKFPKGTLCIWDKNLLTDIQNTNTKMSIVMIEGVYDNFVRIRLYKSYLMEPRYVSEYGGMNNRQLYTLESFHITEFISKNILFRYPRSEVEEIILDLLMNIEPR